jgi:apolipoprotein N-acyltransferase
MKFLTALLLTALTAFAAGFWLDWWSIAIAAFLIALLVHQRAGKAFLSGFLGVFILWGILSWWIDIKNGGILSKKIAEVLPLGGSSLLLILVTAFIGALVAGFGALSGSYLRSSR